MKRHHCEGFWPLSACRRKEARDMNTLHHPARFSFKHLVRQDAPDIVKVGKESVLIEQHCTSSMMGHVEPIREKLAINILNRLLQGNE